MKRPGERDEPGGGTLAEAGARAMYVGCLIGTSCGLAALLVGIFMGRGTLTVAGVLTVGCSLLESRSLTRNGKLASLDRPFAEASGDVLAGLCGEPEVEHLVLLLKQWDDLEHRRGSPEFDPWAVQAVRHDIRAAIERNPALERLFHT